MSHSSSLSSTELPFSVTVLVPLPVLGFFSGAGHVYTTLRSTPLRKVTLDGQRFDPNDPDARLYSTFFCRNCGQEHHPVVLTTEDGKPVVLPRDIDETPLDDPDSAETSSKPSLTATRMRPLFVRLNSAAGAIVLPVKRLRPRLRNVRPPSGEKSTATSSGRCGTSAVTVSISPRNSRRITKFPKTITSG